MADWEDLHAFSVVLQTGSLSAAARFLGVTQPTMRRRLDALEQSLGAPLFVRSQTGLTPTDAARELGRHTDVMAVAAEAFSRAASANGTAVEGVVRITASDVVGAEVLPAVLVPLRAAHPGLIVELDLANRTQDLTRQEADIAVRMVRPAQAALIARRIGTVPLGLFAHRSYLRIAGVPASHADLAHHTLIGPDRETTYLDFVAGHGLHLRRDNFSIRTDSQLAQLSAIRSGLGIGICQVALGRRDRDLVHLMPQVFRPDMETWVVMHEDLRRVRRIRAVFDHLVEALQGYVRCAE